MHCLMHTFTECAPPFTTRKGLTFYPLRVTIGFEKVRILYFQE